MEFIITTDLSAIPQRITFNADQLRQELTEKLDYYNALTVTPDSIQAAKADKAKLNQLKAAMEERRKELKRTCMAPYTAFEAEYKSILAMIEEPIRSIDTQVRAFENAEKQEKYNGLKQYFENCTASMPGEVPVVFDRILNPKWANKTMKQDALEQEIRDAVCRIRDEEAELRQLYADSPHLTAVMNRYMESYNKADALAYGAVLAQQQREAAAVPKPGQGVQQASGQDGVQEVRQTVQPCMEQPHREDPQPRISGTFRVTGTRAQIAALRDFMKQSGIQFEIVR